MTGRDKVLGAIRQRLSVNTGDATRSLNVQARIETHSQNTRPGMSRLEGDARLAKLKDRAATKGTVIHAAKDLTQATEIVSHLQEGALCYTTPAAAQKLRSAIVPWMPKTSIECCVSTCYCAIAESCTLVIVGDQNNPTSQIFLSDRHVVLLPVSQIEDSMESVWQRLRQDQITTRHLTLVSGPSSTGDIEMQMEQGVHGPRELHIILLENE